MQQPQQSEDWHGTTILTVRKSGVVAIGGDGQVSIGQTIVKANAKKVRRLAKGDVIGGFAGATADAFTLFERLEAKLDQYPAQLMRAAVELAKDWRTDRYLRRLEAMLLVADKSSIFTVRSMREWRARRSSMWSKKPIPVAILDAPEPSRFTVTSMSVSLVVRLIAAARPLAALTGPLFRTNVSLRARAIRIAFGVRFGALLSGALGIRHRRGGRFALG